jgi:hypothetical protein
MGRLSLFNWQVNTNYKLQFIVYDHFYFNIFCLSHASVFIQYYRVFFHAFSFYYFFPGIYNEIFFIEMKHVEEPVYLFSVKPKVLFIVIEGISNNSHKKETC